MCCIVVNIFVKKKRKMSLVKFNPSIMPKFAVTCVCTLGTTGCCNVVNEQSSDHFS